MMSLVSALSRFAGFETEAPPVALQDQNVARRALLARAQRGRLGMSDVIQPPRSRNDLAEDFVVWIHKTRGIELAAMDEDSTELVDAYVDSVRESDSQELNGRRGEQAAAWIGERVRNDQNLYWTEDGLITDGRLAFDPAGALRARLDSGDAPTIAQAVEDAMGRIERESLAATSA
jgi:hypothetical protein